MTAGRLKIWNDLAGEWQYTPGGDSQPGGVRVLPVVIDLAALSLGEQTLYTPAVGEWVVVTVSQEGFMASDVDYDLYIGQNLSVSPANYYMHLNDISRDATFLHDQFSGLVSTASSRFRAGVAATILDGLVEDTSPIVAALKPDLDVDTVFCTEGGSWLPNHAYSAFQAVMGSDGALYSVAFEDDGTSGNTEPTWPGDGGTVVDGTVTWTFSSQPTTGTYTAVLLIGGAVT